MMVPSVLQSFIFSARVSLLDSLFIRPIHPKTEIKPDPSLIKKILSEGWWAQKKIHGHRAQIHLSSNPADGVLAYNRQGRLHAIKLSKEIEDELRRLLPLKSGWSAVDAEWVKPQNKLYLFDVLKLNGQMLNTMTYEERYQMLPQVYVSQYVETLPIISQVAKCLEIMESTEPLIEGLVFKSRKSRGFSDSSIVRCRKVGR
jgi:ATP-dependent DNA ligase